MTHIYIYVSFFGHFSALKNETMPDIGLKFLR